MQGRRFLQGLLESCGEGPAWSLRRFLGLGLLLRLPAVLCAHGYENADQQYQSIEPAWHLLTGDAWVRSWEWIDGIRSWVYPGLLAGMMGCVRAAGVDEPLAAMAALRLLHALLSLLPLALFWLLCVRWRPVARPRPALLLFAATGLGVQASVQPGSATFAAVLAVAAVLAASGPRRWPLLGGLCLGLAFCCRMQEALFGPAVVGLFLWQRRWAAAALFAAGAVPGILLQGLVDLGTSGRFLASPFAYIDTNLRLGASSKWQAGPIWFYLLALVLLLGLVPPFLATAWRTLVAGVRAAPLLAVAAAVHLAAHSCIARKALRFALPCWWLVVGAVALGIGSAAATGARARWHRRLLAAGHGALWLLASFLFCHRGPTLAALALRAEPSFEDELLVVGTGADTAGGAFYLRRPALSVHELQRDRLADQIAALPARPPGNTVRWLLVARDSLSAAELAALAPIELAGEHESAFGRRAADRRFVYRLDRPR